METTWKKVNRTRKSTETKRSDYDTQESDRSHKFRHRGNQRFNVKRTRDLFARVANGSLNPESAMRMMNKNSRFRPVPETPSFRTTRSGALAVYGFSPRPVVLYANQWRRLLSFFEQESAFENYLTENSDELRVVNFTHHHRRTEETKEIEATEATEATEITEATEA